MLKTLIPNVLDFCRVGKVTRHEGEVEIEGRPLVRVRRLLGRRLVLITLRDACPSTECAGCKAWVDSDADHRAECVAELKSNGVIDLNALQPQNSIVPGGLEVEAGRFEAR